jgi:hypothetical protein
MALESVFSTVGSTQLTLWIALAVCVCVGLVSLVFGFRTWREPRLPQEPAADSTPKTSVADPFIHGSQDEKRRTARRKGQPVTVLLTDEDFQISQWEGYVMDRSAGGVRVSSEKPAHVGQFLQIQVARRNKDMPWIKVEIVRSQPHLDGRWELGCKFVHPPTWNLLLMFG